MCRLHVYVRVHVCVFERVREHMCGCVCGCGYVCVCVLIMHYCNTVWMLLMQPLALQPLAHSCKNKYPPLTHKREKGRERERKKERGRQRERERKKERERVCGCARLRE